MQQENYSHYFLKPKVALYSFLRENISITLLLSINEFIFN